MRNLFRINIFTYIFLVLAFLSGYFREMLIVYFILIIHELGHYFFMKYYNITINKITLYPYGGVIDSNILINTNSLKVLIISLGGIINQLILFIVISILFKINIINIELYKIFFKYNFYIVFFNLLPIYPLDGFKIYNSILEMFLPFRLSNYISLVINFIFLILFFIYMYINHVSNYMIILFLLLSFIENINNFKYVYNKFLLERKIYNLEYSGLISVKNEKRLYKNKLNYINGISEREYIKY